MNEADIFNLGAVNSPLICLTVLKWLVGGGVCFLKQERHSVYNGANGMLHNRLLSLFIKYF